jgi:hypothetical protein
MDLDGIDGADLFTAAEFVALGFVGHTAYVIGWVEKQDFFRAEIDTGSATGAQSFINPHDFVHGLIFLRLSIHAKTPLPI